MSESWRLIIEQYTGKGGNDRKCLYPVPADYRFYGLNPDDTYEQTKEKLKTVQANNRLKFNLERRAKIDERLQKDLLKESAYLPGALYQRYLIWLRDRRLWDKVPAKTDSHLHCMRKLILELNIEPSEWPDKPEKIYRWFITKKLSLSYIEKVLPLLNAYGYFYCREFKKPWISVPSPAGDIARKIEDANLEERDGSGAESHPISEVQLTALVGWPEDQVRWMRLSVYFGFRPSEIDDLTEKNRIKVWDIKPLGDIPILSFYQKKLIKLDRARRWKRIPCILVEQRRLAEELMTGLPIKRPYAVRLQKTLGEGYGLYGGRKNFEKMMRGYNQKFENISRWLGHSDIRRTERNYRELEAVEFDPISPLAEQ